MACGWRSATEHHTAHWPGSSRPGGFVGGHPGVAAVGAGASLHSAAGDCGTPHRHQSPLCDGVFCNFPFGEDAEESPESTNLRNAILTDLPQFVGGEAQVFTIADDEGYYYPGLMRGMIRSGDFGKDVAIMYTGSTTGTSRNNEVCSAYGPITWQVDRKCHMISASTFDKMCADMKTQKDDMSSDLHAHGARELVADDLTADNLQDAGGLFHDSPR